MTSNIGFQIDDKTFTLNETSAAAAEAAAQRAEAAAETLSGSAAQIAENKNDISSLKEDFDANDLGEQKAVNGVLGLVVSSSNAFDEFSTGVRTGYRVQGTGRLLASPTWFTSDYIPCEGKTNIYISYLNNGVFINANNSNFAHIEQYDSNKVLISGTYQTYQNAVPIDPDAKYIRFSNDISFYNQAIAGTRIIFVNYDAVPTIDMIEPYYRSKMVTYDELNAVNAKVDNNITAIQSMPNTLNIPLVLPANRLDKNAISENKTIDNYGDLHNADGYFTTDFIAVEQYDVIYLSGIDTNGVYWGTTNYNIFKIVCFGADKATVTEYSGNYRNGFQVIDANTKYARMTISNAALNWVYGCITINEKPTRATMIDYAAPYYSPAGVSDETKRGRKILWLGTSIPTYGYPQLLGRKAGATVYNEAIGESCIAKGKASLITTANICGVRKIGNLYALTQTRAEKETLIANWATIASEISATATLTDDQKRICRMSSYEIILDPYLTGEDPTAVTFDASTAYPVGTLVKYDGKLYVLRGDHAAGAAWSWSTSNGAKPLDVPHAQKANLIVLNHAYNDQSGDLLCGENVYNVYTLEGAYNWTIKHILDIDPTMNIVIYGHYSDFAFPDVETALTNVSERWNIPYYRLGDDLGWSTQEINTAKKLNAQGNWTDISATDMQVRAMWLGDGIHPVGEASKKIAQISSPVFNDWIEMYF